MFAFSLFLSPPAALSASDPDDPNEIEAPGVSKALADLRKASFEHVEMSLAFTVPEAREAPVLGRLLFSAERVLPDQPLILDFKEDASRIVAVHAVDTDGNPTAPLEYRFTNEHIIIESADLPGSLPRCQIDFHAGELSLNRHDDFLYTLLVPARARTVFPCMDQPNIKARYTLRLTLPKTWVAASAGAQREVIRGEQKEVIFDPSLPLSTYQFSFVAGEFGVVENVIDGRRLRMLHREKDAKKLARNADAILQLHAESLAWMETHAKMPYPYPVFDIALIPGFQYAGMEHVGAIQYRGHMLLLDEGASEKQTLWRAHLIAHETAHAWYGNCVTMDWFDDVWLKEVFANFIAAKIVEPQFPDVDHRLSFLMDHMPSAAAVDRSEGAHPILQSLDNLDDAGSLYGSIIYHKAPIMMQQLEGIMGEAALELGLQDYLKRFEFSNATWNDLIDVLAPHAGSRIDLRSWSKAWVNEAGLPRMEEVFQDGVAQLKSVSGPPQAREPAAIMADGRVVTGDELDGALATCALLLPDVSGRFYGAVSYRKPEILITAMQRDDWFTQTALLRGSLYLQGSESFWAGDLSASAWFEACVEAVSSEPVALNRSFLLQQIRTSFWMLDDRVKRAPELEAHLFALLESVEAKSKAQVFRTLASLMLSQSGVERVRAIWEGDESIKGLKLSERDQAQVLCQLLLRDGTSSRARDRLFTFQLKRTRNADLKRKLEFIRPSLSLDATERAAFVDSLKEVGNRAHEPWVTEALGYVHHPLRVAESLPLLRPGLELLPEIQATGDIFFPSSWTRALLNGYHSPEAARVLRDYLAAHPDLPESLRLKVLQSGDSLLKTASRK